MNYKNLRRSEGGELKGREKVTNVNGGEIEEDHSRRRRQKKKRKTKRHERKRRRIVFREISVYRTQQKVK